MPILKDLHLRITAKCNFNCRHCYAASWFNENHALDFETTKSLIDQAKKIGCQRVTFTGGEPLVSSVTTPAIKYCLDQGLKVELESNGALINKFIDDATDYIDKIKFSISYEGDLMRNSHFTPTVLSNIKKLVKHGCNVIIQTVITTININEATNIFEFSKSIGIKNRVFLSHSPNGNAKNLPLLELNRWLKFLKHLRETYSHLVIELPDLFSEGAHKKCGWGVHRCEIMPNGDVTSCGPITFNKRSFIAGNIKNQPLNEIWNSSHFNKIRNLKQQDFETLCAKCPYWTTCLGACRSVSYATGGKLLSPHPFCTSFYNALKNSSLKPSLIAMVTRAEEWFETINSINAKSAPETWLFYNKKMNTPTETSSFE